MDLYYVCVLGPLQTLPLWKHPNLIVDHVETIVDLQEDQCYDYIFLPTPVCWMPDGAFDDRELGENVRCARQKGYSHEIVLTATLPIGVAGGLGCHYLPLQQYSLSFFLGTTTPLLFGCSDKLLIDQQMVRGLMSVLFGTRNVSLYYTEAVEMIFLITYCQNYINQSFYKEMSHFCSKNKVHIDFQGMSWVFSQDMTPILIYMIQNMEEAKLDCPILYSCLFRQRYIDIPI
jgi:hypothetical protein